MSAELRAELAALKPRRERLSVSVPAPLAEWVREVAARNDVAVSAVVELALRHAQALNGEGSGGAAVRGMG